MRMIESRDNFRKPHHILCIVYMLFCSVCMHAQVLWEVSGNGAQSKSYILATNRLADMTFIDSIPSVWKCYAQCNKVITEFAMQDYEALAVLRTAALLPDSVRLTNFYTVDEYKQINDALLLNLGMGLDKLGRMKPSYLTEMYRTELMKKWLGYDEQRSMETFFETIAAEGEKPVFGLDDVGETMYMLFDREPFDWQCKELLQIVEYPEREVRQERELMAMYRWGRMTDIAYQVKSPDNQSTVSYSDYQVYARRNVQWGNRLAPYLREGGAFITLNVIYLGGEEGLLACLRKAGYRVRAVNR